MTTRITPLAPQATTRLVLSRALAGNLAERPLTRLLHDLWVQSWTGSLLLAAGGLRRKFAVLDGIVGTTAPDGGRERRFLLEAFTWTSGNYRLDFGDAPNPGEFISFGEPLPLLLEGVFDHASGREIMRHLAVWSPLYPVPTQQLAARVNILGRPRLARLLQTTCTGRQPLESVVKRSSTDPISLMRVIYFAIETHMVLLLEGPGAGVLQVEYQNLRRDHTSSRSRGERRRHGATAALPPSPTTGGFVRAIPTDEHAATQIPNTDGHHAPSFLDPHPAFVRAEKLLARGRAREAAESLATAVRADPGNPAYLAEHTWAVHLTGRLSANDAVRYLLDLLPKYGSWGRSRIHTVLGRIAKAAGQTDSALEQFEAATRCDPQAVEARREQRLFYMRQRSKDGDSWVEKLFGKE